MYYQGAFMAVSGPITDYWGVFALSGCPGSFERLLQPVEVRAWGHVPEDMPKTREGLKRNTQTLVLNCQYE